MLDGAMMKTRTEAHQHMKTVFDFPEYYGRNLDALNDCLREKGECIVLIRNRALMVSERDYGERIIEVIKNCPKATLFFVQEG